MGKAEGESIGEARGEARGRLVGQIELLSGLLKEQVKPLNDLSIEELALIADELQSQLRERGV